MSKIDKNENFPERVPQAMDLVNVYYIDLSEYTSTENQ